MDNKKNKLGKGFDSLLEGMPKKKNPSTEINSSSRPAKEESKLMDKAKKKTAKRDVLKKCTLYLDHDLFDRMAIYKVKSKKDLSIIAGEAITAYLKNNDSI